MATRPDSLETALLMVELLHRIPRTRMTTAKELQTKLHNADFTRDLRTIQRQLEVLSGHFPIERDDRSKPYGYRWRENADRLFLAQLSPQESLVLQLAHGQMKNLLPTQLLRSMDSFFDQARRNLGQAPDSSLERQWPHKIRVVATNQPLLPPTLAPGVLEAVSEALYANRWLDLDYQNAVGKRKPIRVMPLGLAQQGPRLYLVCRYEGFDNERSLALHRIRKAEASTLTFTRPAGFDLAQYDADGRFGFGNGEQVVLRFDITQGAGLHLTESPLSKDQQCSDCGDGWLRISATVVDTLVLDQWLLGFGEAVRGVKKTKLNPAQKD